MPASTIKIKARNVVEGMLMYDRPVRHVWHSTSRGDIQVQVDGVFHYQPDAMVAVTLPGPSPRAPEHEGGVCTCPDGPHDPAQHWALHWPSCPVRSLRLRLWPVGATWFSVDDEDGHDEGWGVPLPGHPVPQNIRAVHLVSMLSGPAANRDGPRSAFCEPEVQP